MRACACAGGEEPLGHAAVRRIVANQAQAESISLAGAPECLEKRRNDDVWAELTPVQ